MKHVDVQDELADGFEVSPLPPIGPGGAPELQPMRAPETPPPRICQYGPCANYHRFEVQLNAEKPLPQRQPDGSVVVPKAPVHTEVHHYCYPTVGVEMRLGGLPVIRCNRWTASDPRIEQRERLDYEHALALWESEQAEARVEAERSAEAAAKELAQMPAPTIRLACGIEGRPPAWSLFGWGDTVADVAKFASAAFETTVEPTEWRAVNVGKRNLPFLATIAQVGLMEGDIIIFKKQGEP